MSDPAHVPVNDESSAIDVDVDRQPLPVVSPSLTGPEIFHIVAEEGREELDRPLGSLWWSAVAAGLVISLSATCQAFLHARLPDAPWRAAVSSIGYCVGFVIVVLGRLQLFTENTITTVLPVLQDRGWGTLARTARLWAIVLAGNLVGCATSAGLLVFVNLLPGPVREASLEIAHHYAARTPGEMLAYGVPAGFLVAAIVWSAPAAGAARFWVVVLLSYMIAAGGLTHVVAGSTELLVLLFSGHSTVHAVFLDGVVPTGVGNVIGGTGFFALLAYAQARDELPSADG